MGDKVAKEIVHCACTACISIDPVMKMHQKNYLQIYIEVCKYKIKKKIMARFINVEFESDSDCDFQ